MREYTQTTIMRGPPNLSKGNARRIEIEVSDGTRKEFKRVIADIDPDLSYEEMVHLLIEAYHEEPDLFERIHKYGPSHGPG